MSEPLVTIITTTYNHEAYIGRALESFVSQETDFPFQVVIADDHSTDATADIIRGYAKEYPDIIRPIYRKQNQGAEENFLATAETVKTKYVAICDGDDYFIDNKKLQKQVRMLEADETLSICYAKAYSEWEDGRRLADPGRAGNTEYTKLRSTIVDLIADNFIPTSTIMYRWRFRSQNIRDEMPVGIQPGDHFLMLLHAEQGDIGFLDDIVSVYRRHEGGIWYNRDTDIEKHFLEFGALELACRYRVYDRFARNHASYRETHLINLVADVVATYWRHGAVEKFADLRSLGEPFFEEFGREILFDTRNRRRERSVKRRKKIYAVLACILSLWVLTVVVLA